MMVIVQTIFLLYTIFIAEQYLLVKITSKEHRLLPVLLVLGGLYNFYQIVYCVTGAAEIFGVLEELLLIQVLFGVIHYKKDFMRLKFPACIEFLLFFSLITFDICIIADYIQTIEFDAIVIIGASFFILVMLIMDVYMFLKLPIVKRVKNVGYLLATANGIVGFSLLSYIFLRSASEIIVPFAIAIAETIIYYLMRTGLIVDTEELMKDQMYDTSEIVTILFDEAFNCIGMNQKAKNLFSSVTKKEDRIVIGEQYQSLIEHILDLPVYEREVEYHGGYYRQYVQREYYKENLRGYIFLLIDISKQKQENKVMEALKLEAESAAKMKSSFLARMSHELRSPLHAILGFSDILIMKKELSMQNRAIAQNIKISGTTLLSLVNSILDYSKLESDNMEIQELPYDFNKMMKEIANQCAINLASKDVKLHISIATPYPKMLLGDEIRVREIIQNLLSNAVKYTLQGSIDCIIFFDTDEKKKVTKVSVQVSDTGIGMTEEQLEHIFDEYISYANKKQIEGTGLGLSIVKQLTEFFGGGITASSDGMSGSSFCANFYQNIDTMEYCDAITYTKEVLYQNQEFSNEMIKPNWIYPAATILVVDDMQINLELFEELVRPWKFKIIEAANGKEAIELARTNEFQMIFLDNMMPEMTGIEAAAEIRTFSDVPIIIITADISVETKKESLERGASDFLGKPVRLEELQSIIEKTISAAYRRVPFKEEKNIVSTSTSPFQEKTVRSFVKETSDLLREIPEYWTSGNREMFRIKVHGIKGVSRSIGLLELSEQAEILEMAVKAGHDAFIQTHLEHFLVVLEQTIHELEENLVKKQQQVQVEDFSKNQQPGNLQIKEDLSYKKAAIEDCFRKMKIGFEEFDISLIDQMIGKLDNIALHEEEKRLLDEVREAASDFSYDSGVEALEKNGY